MDRLVPGAWLEKQLAAPDLRILDCTVSRVVLPQRRSRLPEWASSLVEGHIPGSGHVDLIEELSDLSSGLPFMLPPARSDHGSRTPGLGGIPSGMHLVVLGADAVGVIAKGETVRMGR